MKKIKWEAFKGCCNLTSVTIPESVMEIKTSAFEGCPNVTIYGKEGTKAERYAREERILFESLD
ncbi:MAG: leucine-rich repeat protein [Planctomycetia bacterium]|nr:leucine-rich repeat protein [Planctomycetia bacterium]